MTLSRREFLKFSGTVVGSTALFTILRNDTVGASSGLKSIPLHKKIGETTTICPFCGVGCGFLVASENGVAVNIEGDPDHPINQGAACAKGEAQLQLSAQNLRRLASVKYRAPGSTEWQEKPWEWAIAEIAKRIKKTRDNNWVERDKDGDIVNRTEAIASLGGASLDNEEGYLISKLMRSLGIVYLEHQARI